MKKILILLFILIGIDSYSQDGLIIRGHTINDNAKNMTSTMLVTNKTNNYIKVMECIMELKDKLSNIVFSSPEIEQKIDIYEHVDRFMNRCFAGI